MLGPGCGRCVRKGVATLSKRSAVAALIFALICTMLLAPATEARRVGIYFQRGIGVFPSQLGYVYHRDFGLDLEMDGPQDMYLASDNTLYIVDTGRNRVLKTDLYGNLLAVYPPPGSTERLNKPQGVFVNDDGFIIVADTENKRLVVFAQDGEVETILPQPEHALLGADFHYQPTKVVQDRRGYLYVANSNDYRGLITLDTNGIFRGFFAPNRVPFSLRRIIINMFATEAQKEKLSKTLPTPHSNMVIDQYGYIYSSTVYDRTNQIKKLNSVGTDVLNSTSKYDYGFPFRANVLSNFVDLTVNEKGIISALDSQNGWIFQYDQDRNLLMMFGGKGEERGFFGYPSSIVSDDEGYLYVLDKDRNNVQVFRPTQFAEMVHDAAELYADGRYEDAAEPWREVLKYNTNYALAHSGLGKAFMKLENWEDALHEYRIAENRDGYSEAFAEIRHDWIRNNFPLAVLALIGIVVAVFLAIKAAKWVNSRPWDKSGHVIRTLQLLMLVMFRPMDGFWAIKQEKKGNAIIGVVLMITVFAIMLFDIQYRSYQTASVDPQDVSLLIVISQIFGAWVLWGVANYAVAAITEGEGFFRDVMMGVAYSMGPYIFFTVPLTLLSHILSRAEKSYLDFAGDVVIMWCGLLIFMSVRHLHNFTYKKSLLTTGLAVFGMACILGVLGLMYVLTDGLVTTVREIIIELAIRA